jgi:molecular chaperone GrpE
MSVPPSEERPQGELGDTARGGGIDTENAAATAAAEPARQAPPSDSSDGGQAGIDYEDRWRRAVADLDNVRKRQARDLVQERAAERARVAAAFLPVLDTIDMALAHAEADPNTIVAGVRAVLDQAQAVLSGLGYPRQDDVGVPFDPLRHEVVAVVSPEEAGQPAGAVAAVLRPGYGEPERQLRPAAVTVADRSGR